MGALQKTRSDACKWNIKTKPNEEDEKTMLFELHFELGRYWSLIKEDNMMMIVRCLDDDNNGGELF